MDVLQEKKIFFDPITKDYIPYKNLIVIQNNNKSSYLLFDVYVLIDWIISSNSLINPINNINFSKIQLKNFTINLFNKKIINNDDKIILIKQLENKYFKEVFIFILSKNISITNKQFNINNKLENFFIKNNKIHNKISKELNNNSYSNNSTDKLNNMLCYLYNKLNIII